MLPVPLSPHLPLSCDAPSVDEVDLSLYTGAVGDKIVIRASDDFDPSITLPSVALPSTGSGQAGQALGVLRKDAPEQRALGLYGHNRSGHGHHGAHCGNGHR
jgi:hypothetical protein